MTTLNGQLEKIIFRNDDNGYTVAIFLTEDGAHTVVGNLISAREGEFAIIEGEFTSHPKYKKQFKIIKYTPTKPTGNKNIELFLASGFITGIGPELAKEVVKKFGSKTMDILEHNIDRLTEVKGIASKKIIKIKESWEAHKKLRDLVFFLQEHDISNYLATKIYAVYGDKSIKVIENNPYVLVKDIRGVGFSTADKIAEKLGFPKDSVFRAEAAAIHVMLKGVDEGHCYYPYDILVENVSKLIEIPETTIHRGISALEDEEKIKIDSLSGDDKVYLGAYHTYEKTSSEYLAKLIRGKIDVVAADLYKEISKIEKKNSIEFADEQKEAIKAALTNKVLVLTGGPGTGKTTIINAIIDLYGKHTDKDILLAAPTGKAAKRMAEVTRMDAVTIHRLLEYDGAYKTFKRNESNPLSCDVLIIDEASMIDLPLFYSLIKAVPSSASLIFVGDIDQLPSVGAGNILGDIIDCGYVPVMRLTKIFRQAEESLIIVNSHRINRGEFPYYKNDIGKTDFFYIEKDSPIDIRDTIIDFVVRKLPTTLGLNPKTDIQVLAPMYKGDVGVNTLNRELQKKLNKNFYNQNKKYQRDFVTFLEGDKVMQIRNNYEKDVFNGDVGTINKIYPEDKKITIDFDNRFVNYGFSEMDEIVLAYATTIHKFQGSESPCIVMPMTMQHFILLQRNLLYTGVTRGKKVVVLVGEKKAIMMAIKNNISKTRYTNLSWNIKEILGNGNNS